MLRQLPYWRAGKPFVACPHLAQPHAEEVYAPVDPTLITHGQFVEVSHFIAVGLNVWRIDAPEKRQTVSGTRAKKF